jgi:hypothetical protein
VDLLLIELAEMKQICIEKYFETSNNEQQTTNKQIDKLTKKERSDQIKQKN